MLAVAYEAIRGHDFHSSSDVSMVKTLIDAKANLEATEKVNYRYSIIIVIVYRVRMYN